MSTAETSPERTVPYSEEDSRRWLSWLANAMTRNGRTEFLFEELQPSWLASRGTQLWYIFLTRIFQGVLCGLIFVGLTQSMLSQKEARKAYEQRLAAEEKVTQAPATLMPGKDDAAAAEDMDAAANGSDRPRVSFASLAMTRSQEFMTNVVHQWGEAWWGIAAGLALAAFDICRNNYRGKWRHIVVGEDLVSWAQVITFLLSTVFNLLCLAVLVFPFLADSGFRFNDRLLLGGFALIVAALNAKVSRRTWATDIECIETLGFSRERAFWGGVRGVAGAFAVTVIFDQGWVVLLVGAIIGATFEGLVTKVKDVRSRPNLGIYLSLAYAAHYGVLLGAVSATIWGNYLWYCETGDLPALGLLLTFAAICLTLAAIVSKYVKIAGQSISLNKALLRGGVTGAMIGSVIVWRESEVVMVGGLAAFLTISLLSGFWFGGLEAIRHFTLRAILFFRGEMPFNFVGFLDYSSTKLIFTERVGGSYMFIHRYLQEHFAAIEAKVERSQETACVR